MAATRSTLLGHTARPRLLCLVALIASTCSRQLDAPLEVDLATTEVPADASVVNDLSERRPDLMDAPGTLDWCAVRSPDNVVALAPPPFTSGLATNASVSLAVDAPKGTVQEDVERSLEISELGGRSISGKISWSRNGFSICTLTFTPAAPLVDKTDYLVTLLPRGSFQPKWALADWVKPDKTGAYRAVLTVGSHPRVARIQARVNKAIVEFVRVDFSEGVSALSTRSSIQVVRGGIQPPLTQVWPDAMASPSSPTAYLQWVFNSPTDTSVPIELTLSGIKTLQGVPLDPEDFLSQTNVNGSFQVTLDMRSVAATDRYEWRPTF